jgi:hypothetical protein
MSVHVECLYHHEIVVIWPPYESGFLFSARKEDRSNHTRFGRFGEFLLGPAKQLVHRPVELLMFDAAIFGMIAVGTRLGSPTRTHDA